MLSAKREGINHPYTDHKEHECRNSFLYDAKSTNLGGCYKTFVISRHNGGIHTVFKYTFQAKSIKVSVSANITVIW
jgi:hypothetical protein